MSEDKRYRRDARESMTYRELTKRQRVKIRIGDESVHEWDGVPVIDTSGHRKPAGVKIDEDYERSTRNYAFGFMDAMDCDEDMPVDGPYSLASNFDSSTTTEPIPDPTTDTTTDPTTDPTTDTTTDTTTNTTTDTTTDPTTDPTTGTSSSITSITSTGSSELSESVIPINGIHAFRNLRMSQLALNQMRGDDDANRASLARMLYTDDEVDRALAVNNGNYSRAWLQLRQRRDAEKAITLFRRYLGVI